MQKTKGISLIVLVITIIIMIILAGAIILTLNNSGIIDKASDAVEQTDLATVKELAQTAWAEAYLKTNKSQEEMSTYVLDKLDEQIEIDKYGIIVKTTGVKVAKGWIQDGLIVAKGRKTLEVGDNISYDETKGGTITNLTATDWQVLGANDDGELLILSTNNIVSSYVIGDDDVENAANSWANAVSELDGMCLPYGKGKGATGVRSIKVEDINNITGYDPQSVRYNEGQWDGYGNEVTYSYAGKDNLRCYSKNTNEEENLGKQTFYYIDETNKVVKANYEKEEGILAKVKSDFYRYAVSSIANIERGDKVYTMLFGEFDEGDGKDTLRYMLASQYALTYVPGAKFGIRIMDNGLVDGRQVWWAMGTSEGEISFFGVRAVVALSSDIQLTGHSASGWTF